MHKIITFVEVQGHRRQNVPFDLKWTSGTRKTRYGNVVEKQTWIENCKMVGANSSEGFSSYIFCGFLLYYSLGFTANKAIKLQFFSHFHVHLLFCNQFWVCCLPRRPRPSRRYKRGHWRSFMIGGILVIINLCIKFKMYNLIRCRMWRGFQNSKNERPGPLTLKR